MGRHGLHAAPRRGGKRGTALRTGLLGVSVAVALGATAVTTGMVPVGASFPYVGVSTTDTTVKTGAAKATPDSASDSVIDRQGGLASLSGRGSATSSAPSPSATPPASPSAPASPTPSASAPRKASPSTTPPAASPSNTPPAASPSTTRRTPAAPVPAAPVPSTEAPKQTEAPKKTQAPAPSAPAPTATATRPSLDTHSAEEAAVVTLVNQERAQAGCGPVRANPPLAALAGAFSKDMAARGFFGHDDPEGNTPWDRAAKAGLSGLGGENIARGQGDAESVMRAWMNSPGHKANILNCEFRTLGVGAHFAAGGPWWTQDFGF
ncbi:CAP domain-containing protein [Streptomyces erythrochromogenes]|uniref:CAP domain-containing protein n=1 Tax=Streptomyces erythrochromogenes TaxID=285574 RepID=UPI002259E619|nr:CAP domain-containing protein [Streptomyces erythrochromogenes]MCX5584170.1 CAP domain-containing protein [Streptomyces erythrochromogenes]